MWKKVQFRGRLPIPFALYIFALQYNYYYFSFIKIGKTLWGKRKIQIDGFIFFFLRFAILLSKPMELWFSQEFPPDFPRCSNTSQTGFCFPDWLLIFRVFWTPCDVIFSAYMIPVFDMYVLLLCSDLIEFHVDFLFLFSAILWPRLVALYSGRVFFFFWTLFWKSWCYWIANIFSVSFSCFW